MSWADWWQSYGANILLVWLGLVLVFLAVVLAWGYRHPKKPSAQDDNEQWRYLVERTFIKALDTRARETDHTDAWATAEKAADRAEGASRNITTWSSAELLNATRALKR